MDAFHASQRGEPLQSGPEPTTTVDSEPLHTPQPMPSVLTEEELAKAVSEAVARIEAAELQATNANLAHPQTSRPDPSTGRAALIKMAMAIHKEKQGVLEELDDEAREKLSAMAMQAFFSGKSKT